MDKIINLLESHKWTLVTFILAVIISAYVLLSRTFMNIEYFGIKCLGVLISIISLLIGIILAKISLVIVGISTFALEIILIMFNNFQCVFDLPITFLQ